MTQRKGFTLIELVIVVAIIGILSMIAVPQFNQVTQNAKNSTFEANCQVIVSAIAMYQAGNNGELPANDGALDSYINGGMDSLQNKPDGATYEVVNGVLTASYSGYTGTNASYTGGNFKYPTDTSTSGSGGSSSSTPSP